MFRSGGKAHPTKKPAFSRSLALRDITLSLRGANKPFELFMQRRASHLILRIALCLQDPLNINDRSISARSCKLECSFNGCRIVIHVGNRSGHATARRGHAVQVAQDVQCFELLPVFGSRCRPLPGLWSIRVDQCPLGPIHERNRRLVADGAVGSLLVVVSAPILHLSARIMSGLRTNGRSGTPRGTCRSGFQ